MLSNKVIIANVQHVLQSIICDGYTNLEQHRMKDIESKCPHNKFTSPDQFCQFCIKIITIKRNDVKNNRKNKQNEDRLDGMISMMANGACKQCCFIMATYLPEISTLIPSSQVSAYKIREIHTKQYNHDLNVATSIWWLAILQKPHIFKYIIRHTVYLEDIWWMFWAPMYHIVALTKMQKHKGSVDFDTYLSHIALFGFQILRNAHLLQPYHWKSLLFIYPWWGEWIYFVSQELDSGIIHKYQFGTGCLAVFFTLLCMVFVHSHKILNSKNAAKIERITTLKSKLNEWFNGLKQSNHFKLDDSLKVLYGMFQRLENNSFCINMSMFIKLKIKNVFELKWNNVECQNMKCKQRIGDKHKFYVCSKCLVAKYCRRKCQKHDWNRNNHKKWCLRYVELRATVNHKKIDKKALKDLRNGFDGI